ncbi:MAG: nuclear transport factor 2 family protein [Terrimicrobiaceae bacterium]
MTTKSQLDPVNEYLKVLQDRPGADLRGAKEQEALQRATNFLANLREAPIRENTSRVYDQHAFFNDTIKTERGAAAIERYLIETAKNTDDIRVEILDTARSGNDYYLRWVMDVKFKKFHRGKEFRTIGMTHLRFSEEGKVILHQDYWDSARGIFEQVPVLGAGIRYIRSMF